MTVVAVTKDGRRVPLAGCLGATAAEVRENIRAWSLTGSGAPMLLDVAVSDEDLARMGRAQFADLAPFGENRCVATTEIDHYEDE